MTLFKIEIKEFIRSILYKNKDGKEILNIGSLVGLGIGLLYIIGLTLIEGLAYKQTGQIDNLITFGMLISTYMTFLMSLSAIPSSLFNSKDYLVNATLPKSASEIVTTKLLALYVINIVLTLVINWISFLIRILLVKLYNGALLLFLGLTFVSILLPLFPMALCGFIGYLTSLFKGKVSGGAHTLITIITFVLFMALCGMFGYSIGSSSTTTFDKIIAIIPTIKWGYGAINGEAIDALPFLLASTIPFLIFAVLSSYSYEYINSLQPKAKKLSAKAQETIMNGSQAALDTKHLIKKEFRKMLSDSQFVMTNLMGLLMALLLPIIEMLALGEAFSDESDYIIMQMMIPFITLMMMGAMPPANRIVSYEGKDMTLTKSLPINGWEALKGKYFATTICIGIISILYMIEVLILGQVSVFFAITTGLGIFGVASFENTRVLINDLKDPHFTWNNFNELSRKESKGVINLLISMGLSILIFAFSIWIGIVWDINKVGVLYAVVGAAAFVINNLTIQENIIKYYDKIEIS